MKLFLLLIVAVFSNSALESLSIGQECPSTGGFKISSYTVTPFPPSGCASSQATLTGTFTGSYCPYEILVHEDFNQRQGYYQTVPVTGSYCPYEILVHEDFNQRQGYYQTVPVTGCYTNGQVHSFQFTLNTFMCVAGNYGVQFYLNNQSPLETIACWQYTYTIS
ncbi:hypothetical protein SteCoe_841 [Stentor coeruleus]|uniref:Uncharacterized protein n=1 Tax=Stentor coeruleus TaxID=5963 RepID=A0A1R2D3D6_9CILI|nr:hypothetical protein SteCoe_841 [Stentor coeruleus]